ncbi:MAG: phosphoglucosamine mutase [Methanomassiliicoccaceae archaeon]|jgi:phosphomannomutase/phosphoglucomutase|nr:phosphoglucosamine mutase [Methanomassiliicoccaceae archaeon]
MGRLFGTNGVRGVVNEDLTAELALRLGKAIGAFFKGTLVVASDTRDSGGMIKAAVVSGLMSTGVNVVDIGITPTPALQHYVRTHENASGGVMITASHNPPEFNGIKCIGPTGQEVTRDAEDRIEAIYQEDIGCCGWNEVGTVTYDGTATESYVNAVIKHVDINAIRDANITVVLDCANGAACVSAPLLLRKLGVRAITLNANPQGDFPGHPSEPVPENLKDMITLVTSSKADLGIAHDGDADRTVFISGDGEYVSGDKSMSLIAQYILSERKGLVVTPVSSSSMVEETVINAGGTVMYTAIGSPVVAKAMFEHKAIFGGEENGGLIFPEHQLCRDGAMAAAKMIECVVKKGKLSEQLGRLPVYHIEKRKISCPNSLKAPLVRHLKEMYKDVRTDLTDGLKMIYDDGWALMRPSGTEPKFRIFSESKNRDVALQRANELEIKAIEFVERVTRSDTDGV